MDTLGVVESKSIAAGVALADVMVKASEVTLARAATVCSGRYLIFVTGDREAVATAVQTARNTQKRLSGSFVLANIDEQVLKILKAPAPTVEQGAIGIVECRTVSSGIAASDIAVKRADIRLCRLVAGQGINGKSYFVVNGGTAAVEEAVRAAQEALGTEIIDTAVIPGPDASVLRAVTGVVRM